MVKHIYILVIDSSNTNSDYTCISLNNLANVGRWTCMEFLNYIFLSSQTFSYITWFEGHFLKFLAIRHLRCPFVYKLAFNDKKRMYTNMYDSLIINNIWTTLFFINIGFIINKVLNRRREGVAKKVPNWFFFLITGRNSHQFL